MQRGLSPTEWGSALHFRVGRVLSAGGWFLHTFTGLGKERMCMLGLLVRFLA